MSTWDIGNNTVQSLYIGNKEIESIIMENTIIYQSQSLEEVINHYITEVRMVVSPQFIQQKIIQIIVFMNTNSIDSISENQMALATINNISLPSLLVSKNTVRYGNTSEVNHPYFDYLYDIQNNDAWDIIIPEYSENGYHFPRVTYCTAIVDATSITYIITLPNLILDYPSDNCIYFVSEDFGQKDIVSNDVTFEELREDFEFYKTQNYMNLNFYEMGFMTLEEITEHNDEVVLNNGTTGYYDGNTIEITMNQVEAGNSSCPIIYIYDTNNDEYIMMDNYQIEFSSTLGTVIRWSLNE